MFGILLNSEDLFCILPDIKFFFVFCWILRISFAFCWKLQIFVCILPEIIDFFCLLLESTDLFCPLLKIAEDFFLHFAGNYGFFAFYWKLGISYLHFAEIIDIFSILLEITDLFCIFCILPESADLSNGWRRTWVQCIGAILAWRAPQKPLETQCDRLQHEKF